MTVCLCMCLCLFLSLFISVCVSMYEDMQACNICTNHRMHNSYHLRRREQIHADKHTHYTNIRTPYIHRRTSRGESPATIVLGIVVIAGMARALFLCYKLTTYLAAVVAERSGTIILPADDEPSSRPTRYCVYLLFCRVL
jgi:hypothetical protein